MPDAPTGPPKGPPFPDPLSCDSVPCTNAKAEVVDAGNLIKLKCGELDGAKGRRDVFAAIAAVFATIAVTLFIAGVTTTATAPILGYLPAAILLAAAAVFAVL